MFMFNQKFLITIHWNTYPLLVCALDFCLLIIALNLNEFGSNNVNSKYRCFFLTLTILGTSCIICIIVTNAGTICNYVSNICLLMGLVKQMGHRSLCIDCNVVAPVTSSLCSLSNHSPEIFLSSSNNFFGQFYLSFLPCRIKCFKSSCILG